MPPRRRAPRCAAMALVGVVWAGLGAAPAWSQGSATSDPNPGNLTLTGGIDFLPNCEDLAPEYEYFYGDTAALNLSTSCYAYRRLLEDELLRSKLIHGSDWPILPLPPLRVGLRGCVDAIAEDNWLKRDVLIKQQLGFDRDYWLRAARVLKLKPAISSDR